MRGGDLVGLGLAAATALGRGRPEVGVALVDGPVAVDHPALAGARIRAVGGRDGVCGRGDEKRDEACSHGTFLAGILVAARDADAPAICPGCTLLVRPIFHGTAATASPAEVARAIVECVEAGARVVNLSAATDGPTTRAETQLRAALDHAARRGTLVVAAAGNQATLGSSEITRHPGVIPVIALDGAGRPLDSTNLGGTLARRGLGAPGEQVVSLTPAGPSVARSGTSVAAAVVSGALSLLWSLDPSAEAGTVRDALLRAGHGQRASIVPPPLDVCAAATRLLACTTAA